MKEVMAKNQHNILSGSWLTNALAVTQQCLQWRDTLVMCGWNGNADGNEKGRLAILAETEKLFDCKDAISDRWKKIADALLEEDTCMPSNIEIVVGLENEYAVQPLVRGIFTSLQKKGVKVSYKDIVPQASAETDLGQFQQILAGKQTSIKVKGDGSLRVLQFDTEQQAQRYLVAMRENDRADIYVSRSTLGLDYAQRMLGAATSGSAVSCVSAQEMQLLTLAVELWAKPYNVRALMQWLQVAVHPLHPKIRKSLVRVLGSEGGRDNEQWEVALKTSLESLGEEDRAKYESRLEWALPRNEQDCVKKEAFTSFIANLKQWSDQRRHFEARKNAMLARQLASLSDALSTMQLLVDGVDGDTLEFVKLQQWATMLYGSSEYDVAEPQLGGMKVTAHPGDVLAPVNTLIWADCYNATVGKVNTDFLNAEERKLLEEQACRLATEDVMVEAERQARLRGVLSVKDRLTLVVADGDKDGATRMHPLVIRLKQLIGKETWTQFVTRPEIADNRLSEMAAIHNELKLQPELNIDNGELITMRDRESYSALDTLVNHPADYLLGRVLQMDTMQEDSPGKKEATMGTVAHRVIQLLFKGTADEIAGAVEAEYDKTFDSAVNEKGALLLLPENTLELLRMRMVLRQSIDTLLEIIRSNDLKVVQTEMDIDGEFDLGNGEKLPMTGQADMVLENNRGQWVVFDFKWSAGKSWYADSLKNDTSLQLAIYKHMLSKKREVVATAYYQLPLCKMHTQSNELKGRAVNVVTPNATNDLIGQLRNSYRYRREQFAKGQIDNGDLLEIQATSYGREQQELNLLALGEDKKKKSANKFTHFPLFKTPLK